MTPEGVIMIIVLCLALIKLFQGKFYRVKVSSIKKHIISKASIELLSSRSLNWLCPAPR